MRIDVLTLFPEVFESFLASSIVGRARQSGIASITLTNFRDFAKDRHRSVDDRPFGGGPGMVLMCQPLFDAVEHVAAQAEERAARIMLTPQGEPLTQRLVAALSQRPRLMLLCGHYEGFDERVRTGLYVQEVSVGDYVLSGGEPAAIVLIDAVVRLLPGVVGDAASLDDESFEHGLLEYPHYTRPQEWEGREIPEVLLSGNHGRIAAWRRKQAEAVTRERRPDLWAAYRNDRDDGGES